MKLLPYENFYIITKMKQAEVQLEFERAVSAGTGSIFKSSSCATYFEGYAVNGVFEFKRSIEYRNSFLPEIKGTTEPYLNGSRIHVKMRMMMFVTVFMCVWLGGAAVGGISIFISEISDGHFRIQDLAVFLMFFFGYGLMMGAFKYESRKAKNKLLEMFDGDMG